MSKSVSPVGLAVDQGSTASQSPASTPPLVLVLDDEVFIAMDLCAVVEETGARVLGPALTLDEAFDLMDRQTPDYALLDINVAGRAAWPVARHLAGAGCDIVFISANSNHTELRTEFADAPVIDKPASPTEIRRHMAWVERASA